MMGSAASSDGPAESKAGRGVLASLLQGIARGDESSLAAFYDATGKWVYGLALRILGDAMAAEEVTLDVYLQVWRRAGAYCPERGAPSSWLLSIGRSRAIDRLRSRATRRRREEPFHEGFFDLPSPAAGPMAASEEAERRRLVGLAVSSLPPEQKRAIELAYFLGLTHSEISQRLGEPLGTVKTRIRLGMIKLRELLKPLEDQE